MIDDASNPSTFGTIVKFICIALACSALVLVFAAVLLIASCEMTTEAEDVGLMERAEIFSSMPDTVGKMKRLSTDVSVVRLDETQEGCFWGHEEMGGVSIKYSLVEGREERCLFPTFDNLPIAVFWTLTHPDSYESFLDIYENDRENAWLIKRASIAGLDGISNSLPDYC